MNKKEIQNLNDILTLMKFLKEYIKGYQKELSDIEWINTSSNRAGMRRMNLEVYKKLLKIK